MAQFDEIEIFTRVVETGNITRAAQHMGLSKSRVSECVIGLETRLGVRLLDRSTRRVSPTEAGAIFYNRCARALEELQAGIAEVTARQDAPVGHLRIGAPDVFASRYIAPALAGFLRDHPQVTAEIVEDIRLSNLIEQRLDLSIRIVRKPEDTAIVRWLGQSEVLVCAAPSYLARRGAPSHPSELGEQDCVGFASLSWSREWVFETPEKLSVPLRPVLVCNGTASLRSAAVSGIGLTAIPRWAIAEELRSGQLVPVLQGWSLVRSGIYAVYPSNRLITTKVRRFVDHLAPILRRELGNPPGPCEERDRWGSPLLDPGSSTLPLPVRKD
jgi:DNA-binding transcriptional LysR family regulator